MLYIMDIIVASMTILQSTLYLIGLFLAVFVFTRWYRFDNADVNQFVIHEGELCRVCTKGFSVTPVAGPNRGQKKFVDGDAVRVLSKKQQKIQNTLINLGK